MEKSEINNLPTGMSSEELDELTTSEEEEVEQTDDNLAEEALKATKDDDSSADESVEKESTEEEEQAEEEPETEEVEEKLSETDEQLRAKDSKIASMKHVTRDLEIENARLQGQLEARESMQTKTVDPIKSPLQLAEAAYEEEYGDLEGFAMSGKLYREQKAFDDAQDAKDTATDTKTKSDNALLRAAEDLQDGELSVKQTGGLDLNSVAKIGNKYLTRGDGIDIQDVQAKRGTKAALKESYKIMLRRINAAGGEDAKALENLKTTVKAKPKPKLKVETKGKTRTKPGNTETDIDALITEGEELGEPENEETLSTRLFDFITNE